MKFYPLWTWSFFFRPREAKCDPAFFSGRVEGKLAVEVLPCRTSIPYDNCDAKSLLYRHERERERWRRCQKCSVFDMAAPRGEDGHITKKG